MIVNKKPSISPVLKTERITIYSILSNFNLFYYFLVLLNVARAAVELRFFQNTINKLSFFLGLILTLIFILKNKVNFFNLKFLTFIGVSLLWCFLQYFKYGSLDPSYLFFYYYQIIIAYSLVFVLGLKIFSLYEYFVVRFSFICIIAWAINLLAPYIVDFFISPISLTPSYGITKYNIGVLSILNIKELDPSFKFRNPLFGWEPGMGASFVSVAIMFNLIINKFRLKGNKGIVILFIALLSTMSTTGYIAILCVIIPFYMLNIRKRKYYPLMILGFVVIAFYMMSLDFMYSKINSLFSTEETRASVENSILWRSKTNGHEYLYCPQRFDGLFFQYLNVTNDPILGYGLNDDNSYCVKSIYDGLSISEGNLLVIAKFGLVFALLIYIYYIRTSKYLLCKLFRVKGWFLYFVMFFILSFSYSFIEIPLFLSFMLYSLFCRQTKDIVQLN